MAGTFNSRAKFLTDVTLDAHDITKKQKEARKGDDDYLTISTVHSAKGGQWKSVFVLNVVDGCMPSSRSETDEDFEEERRMLYVAMTRAKNQLTLMVPWRLHTFGNDGGAGCKRTQFIPDKILGHFNRSAISTRPNDDRHVNRSTGEVFDLHRQIRRLA